MYPDGMMFGSKEEHVWMNKAGFEKFNVGDSVSFGAEVYRYIKTGNGKLIDYGLRNPTGIKKSRNTSFQATMTCICRRWSKFSAKLVI